ncbi:MAG: hypothetical protein AAGC77_04430 [Pseudomonadota bacterium]
MRATKPRAAIAALALFGIICGAPSAFAQDAPPTELVETTPLATDAFSTGTLDPSEGALPRTLWRDTDPQTLAFLLDAAPAKPSTPSLGEAMTRTLLSPGDAPLGALDLGGRKVFALARAGLVEEARTVASLAARDSTDLWLDRAAAYADLLDQNIEQACQRIAGLQGGRDALFWVKLRVLCYVQAGEADAADLTLGVLREQGSLSDLDDVFLSFATTGVAPKSPPEPISALHYAIVRANDFALSSSMMDNAEGGVIAAIARDGALEPELQISGAMRGVAMGVVPPSLLASVMQKLSFDPAEISAAGNTATERPNDPRTDALLYQSVQEMTAPEFLRDKATRIALALSLADSFHRAFALSTLYANEIDALDGAVLTPDEAAAFALARMAVGDSVGAGRWLTSMIGVNESVAALPERQATLFIDLVNLLAVLDPQTAAIVARNADVSILSGAEFAAPATAQDGDPSKTAQIIEAAFDAALGGKAGQAGLAALAASEISHAGAAIRSVIVGQSLRAAGMPELQRLYEFETAWAAWFAVAAPELAEPEDRGFGPRIKPQPQDQ